MPTIVGALAVKGLGLDSKGFETLGSVYWSSCYFLKSVLKSIIVIPVRNNIERGMTVSL